MEQTLLLNATFEPIKVINWQRAMTLWCQNKVEIVEVHDKEVRAVKFTFKLPAVVRLLRFVKIHRRPDYVPFTRANIYARDAFKCQYCREKFEDEMLTFDHVIPVSQGGRKDWENIVTCCVDCNRKKGARTPAEAGMKLVTKPKRPVSVAALRVTFGVRRQPESWRDYLYWNIELEDE
jgi:5-methylcytosine-specific restriction endonuclease McrA